MKSPPAMTDEKISEDDIDLIDILGEASDSE